VETLFLVVGGGASRLCLLRPGLVRNDKVQGLNLHQIVSSADLGGRSSYSKETTHRSSTLKTEVAKVFMTTEVAHELVDPNPKDYEK